MEYRAAGANLVQRVTLYPGAHTENIRFAVDGPGFDFQDTRLVRGSSSMGGGSPFVQQGQVIALPHVPGVLHDTIVLETEFRTFFGGNGFNYDQVRFVHPMPDGAILFGGQGKAPEAANPQFIPPQDGTCGSYKTPQLEYDERLNFLAELTCDGRALRFCTNLYIGGGGGYYWGLGSMQVERDDTTGYLLLNNQYYSLKHYEYYTPGCLLPERPPLIDTAEYWASCCVPRETWLGRISRDGILSVGTYIGRMAGLKVLRAHDRSVLLAGVRGYWPDAYPPFRHYTRAYAIEHPGVLLKLNERCDSVLLGVNLSFFGDTVRVLSIAELSDGSVALVGTTRGDPLTSNAWQSARGGMRDVFLARLGADLETVLWSTFIGGDGDEYLGGWGRWECLYPNATGSQTYDHFCDEVMGRGITGSGMNHCLAVDADDGIWLTGTTLSSAFIEMPGMQARATRGSMDMFLARFDRYGQPTMIRTFGGEQPGNVDTKWFNSYSTNEDSEWALNLELLPCGHCIVYGMTWTKDFPLHNPLRRDPWALLPERWTVNTFSVYDRQGTLHFSSLYPEYFSSEFWYFPTGHLHIGLAGRFWNSGIDHSGMPGYVDYPRSENGYPDWGLMPTYNAFQPATSRRDWPDAMLARQYLPLCGEDAIACSFSVPDTIRYDSTRAYLSHEFIPLEVTITNPAPALAVFDLQAELRLPPGIVVQPKTTPLRQDVAPMLAPGDTARASWLLRVLPGYIADTLLPITVVTQYRWADRQESCLSSYGGCRAEIVYLRRDSREPELTCDLAAPAQIGIDAGGTGYTQDTVSVRLTLRNIGQDAVLPGEARLHVTIDGLPGTQGVRLLPVGAGQPEDGVCALPRLQPGEQVSADWLLCYDRRGHARDVLLEAEVYDAIGRLPVTCSARVRIPALPALRCDLTAPERLTAGAGGAFAAVPVELRLGNIADTLVRRAEGEMDLTGAPHLSLDAGEEAVHYLGPIAAGASRTSLWTLRVWPQPVDSSRETVTVWYRYQEDTTRRACTAEVLLVPTIGATRCEITSPDTLAADDSLLVPMRFDLAYVLENIGNTALEIDRHELRIPPDAGLLSTDPMTAPGGRLNPTERATHAWRIRALALAEARRVDLTVLALDAKDSVLSTCVHGITVPGIDGLRCTLTAADTVRFERTPLGYTPSPLPVAWALRNVLDEAQTNIEAVIDPAQAPRFVLAPYERADRTIAVIDSHAIANSGWSLIPLPAPRAEEQDIVVRYRSDQMSAWKECRTTIHIEAWPGIAELRCATGGHDSLFADAAYEIIVPEPFQVSYTATNSGTVTLTGCAAEIVLPEGFALAGSDSVQQFGTLVPGTLAPNESATRWWTVTTTDQLQDFGAKDITWVWTSDQQGSGSGCTHVVQVIPDPSSGITLTPLRLYFEAELDGPLPAAQAVKLWTGGGLAMPWTAQSDTWYIDLAPVAGDHAADISVQPNTTMLNKGLHASTITLAGAAPNLPRRIAVDYMITSLTGISEQPAARTLTLGAVYPHPIPLDGEARLLLRSVTETPVRITLHDLLGRERALLRDDIISETDILILRPAALGLAPGSYLLRALTPAGMSSRMVTVVR